MKKMIVDENYVPTEVHTPDIPDCYSNMPIKHRPRNTILFDESAAEFICEALGIEGVDPTDVVLIKKGMVVTKQDGILKLVDALKETDEAI